MSLGVGIEQNLAPAHLQTEMGGSVPVVNPILAQSVFNPNVKDSRWLTLEVCREFTRNKCTRTDTECKFAHPPPHVEVQNGRVTCCFDSIKGKCQRKEPPCKYLHPPQHLREQLLQNGRNNLILKQFQTQALTSQFMMPGIYPNMMMDQPGLGGVGGDKQAAAAYAAMSNPAAAAAAGLPQTQNNSAYSNLMAPHNLLPYSYHTPSPFISPMPGMMAQLDANGGMPQVSAPNSVAPSQKMQRNDRLEGMNHGGVPGGVMPMIKHRAVDKSGVPVYQPANAAGAYQPLMQFSQQQFVPVTQTLQYYRGDQTSPYSPVAGTMPRF